MLECQVHPDLVQDAVCATKGPTWLNFFVVVVKQYHLIYIN